MNFSLRSISGATLPRSQQAIILLLGFVLAGLWFWQKNSFTLASPPFNPQGHYFVEIRGDLPSSGFHSFFSCPTLQEVWEKAGGRGILLNGSQILPSGTKITLSEDHAIILDRMTGSELLTLGLAINVNQAAAADLEAIPGIGPVLSRRIIEFRETQGLFKDIDDLQSIKSIGAGKLKKIKPYLVIGETGSDRETGKIIN